MKCAMKSYFRKLNTVYQDFLGSMPAYPWQPELDQALFISAPDEDGEAMWKPAEAVPQNFAGLCEELISFFNSFYYWQLRGKYQGLSVYFPPVPNEKEAAAVAARALKDGEIYFPGQNVVLLAACEKDGNDDLLLFYRQNNQSLFVFDTDTRLNYPQNFTLTQLIAGMEAIL